MNKINNIIILSGGYSEEAEVSRTTSKEIAKALANDHLNIELIDPADFDSYTQMISRIKQIDPDIVFIGLHGSQGEDGTIQSLLTLENIPFTGSKHRSSSISMDKYISGIIASYAKLKIPARRLIYKDHEYDLEAVIDAIGFPMVIKPNDSGSSVGISIIKEKIDLESAIENAFKYSDKVIIEKFIDGREITVTILGKEALPVVEIIPNKGWYDYTNKYTKGNTIYDVPAKITEDEKREIQTQALAVFNLFGCSVYGRVDFRYDDKDFYFLEVNTLPGMTELSLTPMAAKEAGLSFKDLLFKIMELSLQR